MGNSPPRNQPQTSSSLESSSSVSEKVEEFEVIRPVVVTGFGRIYPEDADESNFSWRVVEKLSKIIIDNKGRAVPVIKGKPSEDDETIPEPVRVCYSYVEEPSFQKWLDSTDALVYLHLGVSGKPAGPANSIQLETTGKRRGVHFVSDKYPHNADDVDTPRYLSPEGEEAPQTSFDVSTLCQDLNTLKSEVRVPITCSEKPLKLSYKISDDAGRSLCDFLYFVSLELATTSPSRSSNPNFPRNVLFLHIPDTLCLPNDEIVGCYDHCKSEKAEALAEVVEFIVTELLAQIDAAEDRTATLVEQ